MNRRDFLKSTVVLYGVIAHGMKNRGESVMTGSTYDYEEYPFSILDAEIRGGSIKLCGVEHNEKFFNKHMETFEGMIKETDCVVTELKAGRAYPTDRSFERFYSGIHEICKEEGKDVLNVDPLNWENRIMDIGLTLGSCNVMSHEVGNFIAENTLTRTEFLRLGVASYLLLNTGLSVTIIGRLISKTTPFGYGVNDFRNVKIARGLELMPDIMEDYDCKILSLHGQNHSKPIKYYLEHKKIREIKEALYWFPFGLFGDNYIHRYSSEDGNWEEIQKMHY